MSKNHDVCTKSIVLKFTAKTLFGFEQLLANELEQIGAQNIELLNRAVSFEGDTELMYRANLCCRTALRILIPIATFQAHNEKHLYDQVKKIDWNQYLSLTTTFAIDAATNSERFTHSKFASLKVKDAIADWYRDKYDRRPNVDPRDPDVQLNLHISDLQVTISLDSSGENLGKRGYRQESNDAPMSEVLAAGMLMLAGYEGQLPIMDAMTGSGTLAIEAALIASNSAPGIGRTFCFQKWKDYDEELYKKIEVELAQARVIPKHEIFASDIERFAISIAGRNATRAGVNDYLTFKRQDFTFSEPHLEKALIVINPPYGERLEDMDSALELYHNIGSRLKHHFPGHTVWIISSNNKAMKRIGLKPDHRYKLYNGSLECSLNGYTLFEGKRIEKLKTELGDDFKSDPV